MRTPAYAGRCEALPGAVIRLMHGTHRPRSVAVTPVRGDRSCRRSPGFVKPQTTELRQAVAGTRRRQSTVGTPRLARSARTADGYRHRRTGAHSGGYTRAGDDRRWLPSVTWFLARPRLAFRDLRQARRTAGRKALTAKLPGHR